MHISVQRQRRFLRVALHGGHREKGKVRTDYFGQLGGVIFDEPISLAQRAEFWAQLDGRLSAIAAKHQALTAEQIAKVKAKISARIRPPTAKQFTRPARSARAAT